MKRLLAVFWCALSLALAFAAVVGWARGLMNSEGASVSYDDRRFAWVNHDGVMVFIYARVLFENQAAENDWRAWSGQEKDNPQWRTVWSRDVTNIPRPEKTVLGFGAESSTTQSFRRISSAGSLWWYRVVVQLPYWFVLVITALPALAWIMMRERARVLRLKNGQCQGCGFDLAGVYHVCPQCGQRAPLPESMMAWKT